MTQKDPAAQLKKTGLMVLLGGLAIGATIWLVFPNDTSSEDNTLLSQYYKQQEAQAQRLWGNQGSLALEVTRSLKQPGTWSVIVIVLSVMFALACFYLASRPPSEDQNNPNRM
ncbi:MAG TPA: hypothetical protein VFB72_00490 [Verrucomicrobiae bacterium]|nr:hypothetical protein [Verrucomicrobiae bacterium]